MRSAAAVWRTDFPAPPSADRPLADRRAATRSGRRTTDPIQTCSACCLPVGRQQHGSLQECAAAVLRSGGRAIAVMLQTNARLR
jgi:hypothetical protein